MNIASFDPDSGDLGLGQVISLEEFEKRLPVAALALREMQDINKKYQFEGNMRYSFLIPRKVDRLKLESIMDHYDFPEGVEWYKVDGRKIFEVRGLGGGIAVAYGVYLYAK